jgi:hypothetical protein
VDCGVLGPPFSGLQKCWSWAFGERLLGDNIEFCWQQFFSCHSFTSKLKLFTMCSLHAVELKITYFDTSGTCMGDANLRPTNLVIW